MTGGPLSFRVERVASPDLTAPGLIHIAVLDDDPDFRTYIEDFLRDEGVYYVRAYAIRKISSRKPSCVSRISSFST